MELYCWIRLKKKKKIKECNWDEVVRKCVHEQAPRPGPFKFTSYKVGALTATQRTKLSKWFTGLPIEVRAHIQIEMIKLNVEEVQEAEDKIAQSNKHDMCRLVHLIEDPHAQPFWEMTKQTQTLGQMDARKSHESGPELGWRNLLDMFNNPGVQYQNFCCRYDPDPDEPLGNGIRLSPPNDCVPGLESIYSKCADVEPCRTVGGKERPLRDVKWLRDKHSSLSSECAKLYKKYTGSGRNEVLQEYDTMAAFLKMNAKKIETWYMFALLGLKGMAKLGKVIPKETQIQEDGGGKTDLENYELKQQKAYSQKIDAVRKRGYRAAQKEEIAQTARQQELEEERIKMRKKVQKDKVRLEKLHIKMNHQRDTAIAQMKYQTQERLGAAKLMLEYVDNEKVQAQMDPQALKIIVASESSESPPKKKKKLSLKRRSTAGRVIRAVKRKTIETDAQADDTSPIGKKRKVNKLVLLSSQESDTVDTVRTETMPSFTVTREPAITKTFDTDDEDEDWKNLRNQKIMAKVEEHLRENENKETGKARTPRTRTPPSAVTVARRTLGPRRDALKRLSQNRVRVEETKKRQRLELKNAPGPVGVTTDAQRATQMEYTLLESIGEYARIRKQLEDVAGCNLFLKNLIQVAKDTLRGDHAW
eukprot:m.223731 g.223731  ORF g.223731 m.223731 type:complete len:645 (+) comp15946_c0_seq15:491-2425(+)